MCLSSFNNSNNTIPEVRAQSSELPQVQNITAGFRYTLPEERLWSQRKSELITEYGLKRTGNLGILKTQFTFILSLSSGYVTITGLRQLAQINVAREEIIQIIRLPMQPISPCIIHNICGSGRFEGSIPLNRLRECLKREPNCQVMSNSQYFPALFVKIEPKLGTIILFQTGKFSIVGAKQIESLWSIHQTVSAIIQQLP